MHFAAVGQVGEHKLLLITNREAAGKPLPHRPANPLIVVDITTLDTGDVTQGRALRAADLPALDKVRFDEVQAQGGLFFAAETGKNSDARRSDDLNRLWVLKLAADGTLVDQAIYAGERYNREGNVAECGSNPPYRRAGLWVGEFAGATHAFLGGLRTVSIWKFAGDLHSGEAVRRGEGVDAVDLRLDDHAIGYSLLRPDPEGAKLFVFGDCKSRYLAVRGPDHAGADGSRTQSRRRIAVLDLRTADADGLPEPDDQYGDRQYGPDLVREGLAGPDLVLDEEQVRGISLDCRAVLWDIYDVFGYLNVAGNTFGSDCVANRVADVAITRQHLYVIGEGSVGFRSTGLGVSSELLVLDLATGREVLAPGWQWFYDGSALRPGYGYFGLTLGERAHTEVAKGLFLVGM